MSNLPRISESEWKIMEVIWSKNPVPVSDIIQAVQPEHGWKEQTIRTMLTRLVRKGALVCDEGCRPIQYTPAVDRQSLVKNASHRFFDRVFAGASAPVILQLVKESKFSEQEMEELRSILEDKEGKQS
ncbi:MAG: BlaI/MecI/CopY family transcriptional regulator [Verrucomicrobiota bacterium]